MGVEIQTFPRKLNLPDEATKRDLDLKIIKAIHREKLCCRGTALFVFKYNYSPSIERKSLLMQLNLISIFLKGKLN